jgi:hypothetical protein
MQWAGRVVNNTVKKTIGNSKAIIPVKSIANTIPIQFPTKDCNTNSNTSQYSNTNTNTFAVVYHDLNYINIVNRQSLVPHNLHLTATATTKT